MHAKNLLVILFVFLLTACKPAPTPAPQSNTPPPTVTAPGNIPSSTLTPQANVPIPTNTSAPTPTFNPSPHLGAPFSLSGGQSVALTEANLTLRFADVLEDSRCPAMVLCAWSGEARIALALTSKDGQQTRLELSSLSNRKQNQASAGAYSILLQSVVPYPQTPDQKIPFKAYNITLIVERNKP